MERLPKEPSGIGKQADCARRTAQVIDQNKPFGGPGMVVRQTTRGTFLHAKRRRAGRRGKGGTDDLVWL
jgi:hypothetical protein